MANKTIYLCEWCKRKTIYPIRKYFPIERRDHGTQKVALCGDCFNYYCHKTDYDKSPTDRKELVIKLMKKLHGQE